MRLSRWRLVLRQTGIPLRRGLGQNFLVDDEALQRMAAQAPEGSEVLELGSGPGNLTELLAMRASHVWAFETDPAWMSFARERIQAPKVEWHLEDGENFSRVVRGRPVVVSNLPYSAYRRLLLALFAYDFACLFLTLQEDVWRKISARPGTAEYGPLAVLAQAHYIPRKIFDIPRGAFHPVPGADSTFFRLEPAGKMSDPRRLDRNLKAMFSRRRKKARGWGVDSDLAVERVEPGVLAAAAEKLDDLVHRG